MSASPTVPLDLSRQASIWQCVENEMMPRIASRLERKFHNRYGACPEGAVASAVRVLLEHVDTGTTFESPNQIYSWLVTAAYRKLLDQLRGEHLANRDDLPGYWATEQDGLAEKIWTESSERLDKIMGSLNSEQRIVMEGRLAGKTYARIAEENGWTIARVNTLWRQISRLAMRLGRTS